MSLLVKLNAPTALVKNFQFWLVQSDDHVGHVKFGNKAFWEFIVILDDK